MGNKTKPQHKPKPKGKAKKEKKGIYDDIKKELEKQKVALLAEAGEIISSGLNPGSENLPDLSDQASAEIDQNFTIRLKEREQKLLKKIDEAIDRIVDKTFGVCESCGGEISLQRLKARPVTTLCISCKTEQEKEEMIRR
jgi:DnaK suppressor protein